MAPTLEQIEKLLADVGAKLESLPVSMTPEQVKEILTAHLKECLEDPEFARKMRWQDPSPAILQGSKFARYGLSVADIEFLYDLQTALKGHVRNDGSVNPGPSEALENAFKSISSAFYLSQEDIRAIDRQALDGVFPRVSKGAGRELEMAIKDMDTAESGYGQQLVGAQYVGNLWEVARRESKLFGLLDSFEMTAPTAYLPVEVDFPEMLFVGENTSFQSNGSNEYTTVKTGSQRVAVTAAKFVMHQVWSGEMEEDAILPFVPFLQRQAAKGLAHYLDSVVLNGDNTNAGTGNINLVDADPADTKHYLAFDGIRHVGLVDNTANSANANGAVTYKQLRQQLGRMTDRARFVDWGHPNDPNDVIYTADVDTCDRIAELDEVLTMDKYGQLATVLNGEVVKIGRSPLICSMAMSKTDATGNVSTTGGNNTKGQVACFNRKGFVTGWRRRVKLETERLPGRDQTRLVYSLRLGLGRFTPTGSAAAIEAADILYNINVS